MQPRPTVGSAPSQRSREDRLKCDQIAQVHVVVVVEVASFAALRGRVAGSAEARLQREVVGKVDVAVQGGVAGGAGLGGLRFPHVLLKGPLRGGLLTARRGRMHAGVS